MLAVGVSRFNFQYSNANAPSTTPGTSVIPGASNAEGDWTEVASSVNISQDVWMVILFVYGGGTSGQIKDHLLDIGYDPAGGTSYSQFIENIVCGGSSGFGGGHQFVFPIRIPSGSSVAVRIQGSNATAGTVRVIASFFGQPSRPELVRAGQYAEVIGAIVNSQGVAFTPGNSGAEGAWTSLGTTTRALWWWQLAAQISDSTMSGSSYHFDLAYGDASNKTIIIENIIINTNSSEIVHTLSNLIFPQCFCEVPAGAELFVRGSCSGTTDSNLNAVAVGVGG